MAKIIKTNTGYKMRVFLGREEAGRDEQGKPIFKEIIKQISASTMAELRRMEARLITENKDPKGTRSFRTAFKEYIHDKESVLSPATVANYQRVQTSLERRCPWFMDMNITEINKPVQQRMVSELSTRYALNTVKTFNSTVASVLKYNDVPSHLVKFNEGADTTSEGERYIPTEDVIKRLIEDCRGTDLEPAILLAAFGPMRRGEIGGLTWEDFDFERNVVNVHAAKVRNPQREFITKAPKTRASKRELEYPGWVMERIRSHKEILPMTIDALTSRFSDFLAKHGYPHFRFHDLRHFAASYYLKEGVPEVSVQRRGGWATDNMMRTVYRHEIARQQADLQILASIDKFKA